ncbi:MAG: 4Fe-4S binding protein [Candidatus Bathyarchaeia archaeon]
MEPATSTRNAVIAAAAVGGFCFYLFFRPYLILGVLAAAFMGAATFWTLRAREVQHVRRTVLITFSLITWAGTFAILAWIGPSSLVKWVADHLRVYYFQGMPMYGTTIIPCTRALPEITLGIAMYGQSAQPGVLLKWPSSLVMLIMVMVPFVATAVVFGRGWCGWMCFFGGTVEAFMSGSKSRWPLRRWRMNFTPPDGEASFLGGLKEEVKDIKYGIALALLLVGLGAAVPIICIVCWTFLIQYLWIGVLFIAAAVLFAMVVPFMTKKRWFCILCPVGAMIGLVESLSPFRVKIDKEKCDKCYDCMRACPMYAMTPKAIEEKGKPVLDCIKCGRCIEVCPKECIDLYLRGTNMKVRSWFVPLALGATAAWYVWFVFALIQLTPHLLGI